MKKFIFVAAGLVVCLLGALNVVLNAQTDRLSDLTLSGTEAMAWGEEGFDCRWKQMDCIYPYDKHYEFCSFAGDGHSCSPCGEVSRDCN